jgi:hypothetical protein
MSTTTPNTPSTMTREEWQRRYAAHLMDKGGMSQNHAIECAEAAGDQNFRNNGDEWLDPEDDADVEMSYWDDDGEQPA